MGGSLYIRYTWCVVTRDRVFNSDGIDIEGEEEKRNGDQRDTGKDVESRKKKER